MASVVEVPMSHQTRGEGLRKRKSAYGAADGNKHRMLKYIMKLITSQAATVTSYGAQVVTKIRASVLSTVPKSLVTVASSRAMRRGHEEKDEEMVTVKPTNGMVIEIIRPNSNEKLKEEAVINMSSSGTQFLNKHVAYHSSDIPNELAVVDYVEDIYKFYKDYEKFNRPLDYIHNQVDISEEVRATVVDWVVAVHYRFALRPETLYLTINIMDRYLSVKSVQRSELKLVSMSALLISCKYEEIKAPEVDYFIDITEGAYTREEVLAMEKEIVTSLQWRLTVPTQYVFLLRFLQATMPDKEMERMVFFLAELGLMHYSMVKYSPSIAAASAVYAAQWTLKKSPHWTETLEYHTGWTETQLLDCAQILVKCHLDAPKSELKVVYDKYSIVQFGAVALHQPATELLHKLMA